MTIDASLALCIINGYPRANRQVLAEAGVTQADELYLRFFRGYLPHATFNVLFIADLDVSLPTGVALRDYDGFVWTGSNLTIYEDKPEVSRQIEFCRAIYQAGVPQYGSCWGVQMAAVAAGGEVRKNPNGREWCVARDITLSEAGRAHSLYQGKPDRFDGFIMHLDEVTRVPEGGTLLASNRHTRVQALEVRGPGGGIFWATQYHPEYSLDEMARLLIARKRPLTQEGFFASEQSVESYVERLLALVASPEDGALRTELRLGPDILEDHIRQCELRNWLQHLVIPLKLEKV